MSTQVERTTNPRIEEKVYDISSSRTDWSYWGKLSSSVLPIVEIIHATSIGAYRFHIANVPITDSSTTDKREIATVTRSQARALFISARDLFFEDGIENDFSKGLFKIIQTFGTEVMPEISRLILSKEVNADVAAEALRWLGLIDDSNSYAFRLWILEECLISSSARVRDAAAVGLSYLDDPHATEPLRKAIGREDYEELRADMRQVLNQLEHTQQCRPT